jgi:hypothetical protein
MVMGHAIKNFLVQELRSSAALLALICLCGCMLIVFVGHRLSHVLKGVGGP